MDPRNGGDLLCSQEGVYPVPRRGRREGGAGYGCCPIEVGGGDPQDCNQNLLEHLLSYPDLLDLRHFSTRIFHSTALQ